MRHVFLCVLAVGMVAGLGTAADPLDGMQPGLDGQAALARLPRELLAQLPRATIDGLLSGQIPTGEFLASLGLAPPVPPPSGVPTEFQQKQFITHWLYHYNCLSGGIGEDLVGEAGIDGRCSSQTMTADEDAPYMYPNYWSYESIGTYYYNAPWNDLTCTYDNTDVTRYWVTWVRSPSARAVKAWLGASDYFKLWINGALVLSRTAGGMKPWTVDEYKGNASLVAGWNLIVLKQTFPQLGPYENPDDNIRYKYFSLRFVSDDAGTVVGDLVGAFDPNCTESNQSLANYSRVIVPSVAHLPGAGGSQWNTDITLNNMVHMRWLYRFRYFREGANGGTPDSEKLVELAPFEVRTFADALRTSLFNVPTDQKGYFWVLNQYYYFLQQYYGWLLVKVYNQAASGTFGMTVPILYTWDGTSYSGVFFGLRHGAYRSNFGLAPGVNGGATASVRLKLFGPDIGAVVTKDYAGITGFWQLNNVFADMGKGGVNTSRGILYFEFLDNPTGTYWYPYVTVNDGNPTGTSDPLMLRHGSYAATPPDLN